MNELQKIGNHEIFIKNYKGQRVVTLKDIDTVHERPDGTARRNFNSNKQRFVEGKHFFIVSSDEIRTSGLFPISDSDHMAKVLMTEQGYLKLVKSFTDDLAWEVQDQLIDSYFKVRQVTSEELSPELQMLQGLLNQMVQKELTDKERDRQIAEARRIADRAAEATENIKEAVKPILDNWREGINLKFNRIQKNSDKPFNLLRSEMYIELERRAGCDLSARLRNKRQRMADQGRTKTEINNANKMDIIGEDKKLREIFSKIVQEYEIKCCV